jgi:hypothetical protein
MQIDRDTVLSELHQQRVYPESKKIIRWLQLRARSYLTPEWRDHPDVPKVWAIRQAIWQGLLKYPWHLTWQGRK